MTDADRANELAEQYELGSMKPCGDGWTMEFDPYEHAIAALLEAMRLTRADCLEIARREAANALPVFIGGDWQVARPRTSSSPKLALQVAQDIAAQIERQGGE